MSNTSLWCSFSCSLVMHLLSLEYCVKGHYIVFGIHCLASAVCSWEYSKVESSFCVWLKKITDKAGNIVCFHVVNKTYEKTRNNRSIVSAVAKPSFNVFLFAIDLCCCPKLLQTHQWDTQLQWLTCSFITINVHSNTFALTLKWIESVLMTD